MSFTTRSDIGSKGLFEAVKRDNLAHVQKLLKDSLDERSSISQEELVNLQDEDDDNTTPLHYTSSAAMTRLLVDHGARMDTMDNFACTPLHLVNAEAALVLIELGAEVDPSVLAKQVSRGRAEAFTPKAVGRAVAVSFDRSPSRTLVHVMKWAAAASREHRRWRASDVTKSDAAMQLNVRLQLALGGCIAALDETEDQVTAWNDQSELLRRRPGQTMLRLAVSSEAKVLISQTSVQRYLTREWRGLWLDQLLQNKVAFYVATADFILRLLPQNLLLLLLHAIWPPLEEWVSRRNDVGEKAPSHLLSVPAFKFTLAAATDLMFTLVLTVSSPTHLWLLMWGVAALFSEISELLRGDGSGLSWRSVLAVELRALLPASKERSVYFANMWNMLDLPAMVRRLVSS
jgi:hypothetical protein